MITMVYDTECWFINHMHGKCMENLWEMNVGVDSPHEYDRSLYLPNQR